MRPPLPDRQLLATLLDKKANLGTRDEIATELGAYVDPEVESVLRQIVCDVTDDEMVVDSAGESLREIWKRNGKIDKELISHTHPAARKFSSAKWHPGSLHK